MKVAFVGDAQVGKTCIICRSEKGTFDPNYAATVGAVFSRSQKINSSKENFTMEIWDTGGQERYRPLGPLYYRIANIIVLVYDITNHKSFDSIDSFLFDIRHNTSNQFKIFVVGNKSDLESERQVATEEGRSYSIKIKAKYFCEVSAKNDININKLFTRISDEITIHISNPSSSSSLNQSNQASSSNPPLNQSNQASSSNPSLNQSNQAQSSNPSLNQSNQAQSSNPSSTTSLNETSKLNSNKMISCKVVFVGETKTGKSSILSKFIQGTFDKNMSGTTGVVFCTKNVINSNQDNIRLQIWDASGLEKYRSYLPLHYQSAHVIVFIYDITNRESFENLENWVSEAIEKPKNDAKIIIVGNKADLSEERKVTNLEGRKFADDNNASYFYEVSAKENINIDELFLKISDAFRSFYEEIET